MSEVPLVSVCIPTYNGTKYLRPCLDSVAAQTLHDLEILVIDDCSTDNTASIAEEYAEHDSRFRIVVNNKNLGLVGNWNKCIRLARGEWLKFAFQDDLLTPDCLEQMLQTARTTDRGLIFSMRDFVFEEGLPSETVAYYRALPTLASTCGDQFDVDPATAVHLFLTRANGRSNFFGEPTCALINRDVFTSLGQFNHQLIQLCDLEYWLRVASNLGFAWCPQSLASFRVHSGSTSQHNAARKAFRSLILDRLIIVHQLAYASEYKPFRGAARRHVGFAHYQRKLARDAFWAMNYARASTDEPGMWLDWEAVALEFPHLRSSLWHLPYQANAWAERNILWRWRRASKA